MAKRHMVKTFPLPTAQHDTRDVWAWDAGYCNATWPLETERGAAMYMPGNYLSNGLFPGYCTHYAQMGSAEASMRACLQTSPTAAIPHLPDYVQSEVVHAKMTLSAAMTKRLEAGGVISGARSSASARAWPRHCSATLVQQESLLSKCTWNATCGCLRVHTGSGDPVGDAIWISGGCRGIFRCENGVAMRCGQPGWPKRLAWCTCVEPSS